MYAVIRAGGQQHKVSPGELLTINSLGGEVGSSVEFGEVLHIGDGDQHKIGSPVVDGAKVTATIVRHLRGPKILVFKFKRRKGYEKRRGHRQELTEIRITDIAS